MKKYIFWILLSGVFQSTAQSLDRTVVASGGTFSQGTGISLSSTVGEIATSTLTAATSILTQGFQQPDGLFVGIVDAGTGKLSYLAFPNPVHSELTLELNSSKNSELVITLHDMLGRIVSPPLSQILNAGEAIRVQIDVAHLIPAMYFVRIDRKNDMQTIETLRIVKSH